MKDIELFEINEAFAAPSVAVEKELGLNREIVNVNGGGIALGHPIGNTGCRLVVSLIHEMEKRGLTAGDGVLVRRQRAWAGYFDREGVIRK